MRIPRLLAAGVNMLTLTFAVAGDAEPPRLHTAVGAARPVTGYQVDEFGWGSGLKLGMELPFAPQFGVAVSLGALYLSDGGRTPTQGFAESRAATAYLGGLDLHLRPFAVGDPSLMHGLSGVWLGGSFGVTRTGDLQRMTSDLSLGYDVLIDDGTYALGPYLSVLHVFQPERELRQADANILVFGLHLLFDSADRSSAAHGGAVSASSEEPDEARF